MKKMSIQIGMKYKMIFIKNGVKFIEILIIQEKILQQK